jgi:hypothetical protein
VNEPSETPEPPVRRRRRGGRKPGPRPGQKPFDPLARTWTERGKSWLARKAKTDRERRMAEAEFLAKHLQLDERGRLPSDEAARDLSLEGRQARYAQLTNYPRIPEGERDRLEHIIATYGLPLSALSSDTAAFIVRRVMMDFHKLSSLRRANTAPMFTPEELIELMQHLKVTPTQLADMLAGSQGPAAVNNARGSVFRWMHGASKPTSTLAVKLNALIDRYVRRPLRGGYPAPRKEEDLAKDPETAKRRTRYRAQQERRAIPIPLAPSARKDRPGEADATETDR